MQQTYAAECCSTEELLNVIKYIRMDRFCKLPGGQHSQSWKVQKRCRQRLDLSSILPHHHSSLVELLLWIVLGTILISASQIGLQVVLLLPPERMPQVPLLLLQLLLLLRLL